MKLAQDKDLSAAILRTVIYSEIFDYAPSINEIFNWLIGPLNPKHNQTYKDISNLATKKKGIFFLHKGRVTTASHKHLIKESINKANSLKSKIKTGNKYARILGIIPTIQLIAISGSVAAGAPKENDDIDLLIITKSNYLWITRLLVILLSELLFIRRRPNDKNYNDKICLNLFLDEKSIQFPKSRHDLYTARELLQIIPLINRNQVYEKLIVSNKWTSVFFPMAWNRITGWVKNFKYTKSSSTRSRVSFLEETAWIIQKKYMANRQTTEKISPQSAFFHPFDYRHYVVDSYHRKLNLYNKIYCEKNFSQNSELASSSRQEKNS